MNLIQLLDGLVNDLSMLDSKKEIKGLTLDSREIKEGFVFVAVAGANKHGLFYLPQALKNGAYAVIYDPQGSEGFIQKELTSSLFALKDLDLKLGIMASRFYQSPSKKLDVIGITGTNGKTTCSQFLLQLIPESGVIGTLGWGRHCALIETLNTTPDILAVQKMLADFRTLKVQTVLMEVSSHGLQQGRVNDVCFKGAVFTNLSRDHLDYHGSMKEYLNAKLILFKQHELQFIVVNTDDESAGHVLAVAHKKAKQWAFSATGKECPSAENVTAKEVKYSLNGIEFMVCWRKEKVLVQTKIVGDFNLENILAVITVLLAQGVSLKNSANRANSLTPVTGRMEKYGGLGKPYVFIDYAHTPDALEKVLISLRKYCMEKMYLVFGCGGNRDRGKRQLMGEIAEKFADQVMITNDNPRFENPEQIINDIKKGFKNKSFSVILDREQAIKTMIDKADKNDCIVIAGKGHESYQDVEGVKLLFSDQDIVKQALQVWDFQKF